MKKFFSSWWLDENGKFNEKNSYIQRGFIAMICSMTMGGLLGGIIGVILGYVIGYIGYTKDLSPTKKKLVSILISIILFALVVTLRILPRIN